MPRDALLRLVERQEGVGRRLGASPALFRPLASLLRAQQLFLVSAPVESYKMEDRGGR